VSDWRDALAPTPECIPIERIGDELTQGEREHLDSCARCQSELALFRETTREEVTSEEASAAAWIAGELRTRNNVVAFRPKMWRTLYAVAAALVIVLGAAWWMQFREPSIDGQLDGPGTYRSGRLELVAPIGDIATAPNEFRWKPVAKVSRYRVRILEVDATPLWSVDTAEAHVQLPPDVVEQFLPGKTLQWEVRAFRGNEMIASSETQVVRVNP
jgi:hypothetical protein